MGLVSFCLCQRAPGASKRRRQPEAEPAERNHQLPSLSGFSSPKPRESRPRFRVTQPGWDSWACLLSYALLRVLRRWGGGHSGSVVEACYAHVSVLYFLRTCFLSGVRWEAPQQQEGVSGVPGLTLSGREKYPKLESPSRLGTEVQAYNLNTQEVEAGESEVQGQPQLHSKLKA